MRKTKALIIVAAILANCLLFALSTHAQVKFMPDYISVGSGSEPMKGYMNFLDVNGINWKHLNHHFRIDLTGSSPAICGTNDRVDFADMGYNPPYYYIPFTCAAAFSVWTNQFLYGKERSALLRLSTMQPQKVYSETDDRISYVLKDPGTDVLYEKSTASEDTATDYTTIIPMLFQSLSELKAIVDAQAKEIEQLETLHESNSNTTER